MKNTPLNRTKKRLIETLMFSMLITLIYIPKSFAEENLTPERITNYYALSCENIFAKSEFRLTNITYWQKLLFCSKNNSTRKNRELAKNFRQPIMPDALIWSILISHSSPNIDEMQKIINLLNNNQDHIPIEIMAISDLLAESISNKLLYTQYTENNELHQLELDTLIQENKQLSSALSAAEKKLLNLAEIERQLSQRRQIQLESQLDSAALAVPTDTNNTEIKPTEKEVKAVSDLPVYSPLVITHRPSKENTVHEKYPYLALRNNTNTLPTSFNKGTPMDFFKLNGFTMPFNGLNPLNTETH